MIRSLELAGRSCCGRAIIANVLLLAAWTVLLGGCAEGPGRQQAAEERASVLLITLDTTRADYLGCYGHDGGFSPNIDVLAADSVLFERAISTSALTPMSHASILTGLNPYKHGLRTFYGPAGNSLPDSARTLATVLGAHGWTTAAFISSHTASQQYGLNQGFELFDTGMDEIPQEPGLTRRQKHGGRWLDGRLTNTQRRGDATADRLIEWLEGTDRPFFVWAHFFDPHDLLLVPPKSFLGPLDLDRRDIDATCIAMYGPEIRYMDAQIGRILETLRATRGYESTLIVVVADHGQGLGQHGWMRHRILYQEDIRVPLIIRAPGGGRAARVSALVRTVDIFPTILEYLDVPLDHRLDGRSLRRIIDGGSEEPRMAYAEALNTLDAHSPRRLPEIHQDLLFSVLDGEWKLIHHQEHPENSELYHLASDAGELKNVIGRYPEERERLMAYLRQTGGLEIEIREDLLPQDPEVIEKLKSLGYVQ